MAEEDLIHLIESHSAELAAVRSEIAALSMKVTDGFQMLNWKLEELVEIVDGLTHVVGNLNSREIITDKRLTKLESDVSTLKGDVAAIKAKLGA